MKDEKKIRILIKVPENWIDIDSPTLFAGRSIYDMAVKEVKQAVVEQYLKEITLPKVRISAEELKDRMIQILAERALEDE